MLSPHYARLQMGIAFYDCTDPGAPNEKKRNDNVSLRFFFGHQLGQIT
jgi:hypothetical protein